ncbi:MAG: peptidoglycan-binding protein [Candidatus Paceibacterota bacterium]
MIQQLQAQIATLQAELAQLQGGAPTVTGRLTADLSPGDRGPQVRTLQQMLNAVPGIRIASSGAGAPGNETDFFGSLTTRAVIALQEQYAAEILAPWNLVRGTGFVGRTTRAKLNELAGSPEGSGTASGSVDVQDPAPVIARVSPSSGTNGDRITIHGMHFTPTGNTIVTNHTSAENHQTIDSPDGTTLTFTLDTDLGNELSKQFSRLTRDGRLRVQSRFPNALALRILVRTGNGESNDIRFDYEPF